MKLIAGLGNPGYEYALTPHNLGFLAVDRLAELCGAGRPRSEAQAITAEGSLEGTRLVLAKPQTFMNLSGAAVARLLEKYMIPVADLIVLVDDADLPFGALRIRSHGTAGGHNGLKSIIAALGSDQFARVRMGIGGNREVGDRADYVLRRFRKSDLKMVADMVNRAAEAVMVAISRNIQTAMNDYNRREAPPEDC